MCLSVASWVLLCVYVWFCPVEFRSLFWAFWVYTFFLGWLFGSLGSGFVSLGLRLRVPLGCAIGFEFVVDWC